LHWRAAIWRRRRESEFAGRRRECRATGSKYDAGLGGSAAAVAQDTMWSIELAGGAGPPAAGRLVHPAAAGYLGLLAHTSGRRSQVLLIASVRTR